MSAEIDAMDILVGIVEFDVKGSSISSNNNLMRLCDVFKCLIVRKNMAHLRIP